jgi:hypothetical protein
MYLLMVFDGFLDLATLMIVEAVYESGCLTATNGLSCAYLPH